MNTAVTTSKPTQAVLQWPVEQLTSSEPPASDFAAKPNLIRAIWAGPAAKIAT